MLRWNKADIPHKGWEYIGMEDLGEDYVFIDDGLYTDSRARKDLQAIIACVLFLTSF